MCRSLSSGAGGENLSGGIPQFLGGCGVDAIGEAPLVIGIPFTCWQMAHIHSHAPVGNDVSQLDAIAIVAFPVLGMGVVQVNEANPAVNLLQFLVSHVPSHVMLEEHGVVDEALGSGMPMEASVLLGIFD